MIPEHNYGFKSAGHAAILSRAHSAPGIDLAALCLSWLDRGPKNNHKRSYLDAGTYIKSLIGDEKISLGDANAVLVHPGIAAHQHGRSAGLFASALYCKVPDTFISIGADTSCLWYLGAYSTKTLVNAGITANGFGMKSNCFIVNKGTAYSHVGREAQGIIINLGTVLGIRPPMAYKGVFIDASDHFRHGPQIYSTRFRGNKSPLLSKHPKEFQRHVRMLIEYAREDPAHLALLDVEDTHDLLTKAWGSHGAV
jgi:hypothetical protein